MTTLILEAPVGPSPERAAGASLAPRRGLGPLLLASEVRRWDTGLVFVGFAVFYTALGQWMVRDVHLVGFETLARFQRALTLALDPARGPAALADDPGPLATLLTAPVTLAPALLRSFVVVPVVSAVFAAATMVVLHTLMRRAGLGATTRVVGLLAVGFNPLILLYAADGDRLFIGLCFALGAVSSLLSWRATTDVRFLLAAGVAFGLAVMCDYDVLAWLLVTVIIVAATLVRLGAAGDEVGSTVVALTLPTAAALGLWTLFGLVVTGRPFSWLAAVGRDPLGPTSTGERLGLSEALQQTGSLVLHGAPLALLVLPALMHGWLARRDLVAGVLAGLLATVVLLPGLFATLGRSGPPLLREAVPILLVSVVGALWSAGARTATPASRAVGILALLVVVASLPWTWRAMSTYDHQVLEAGFVDAASTGRSQEGAITTGGAQIGYASEAAMASWILTHVTRPGSILTDETATYAVLLRAASPGLFRDSVELGADRWRALATEPSGDGVEGVEGVDYLLISTDPRHDRLSRLHPTAAAGADPRSTVSYRTPRYVLVEVLTDDRRTDDPDGADDAEVRP